MTKVIIDNEKLEKLLEVIGNDCPAEIFNKGILYCPAEILNKEIPWCSEEFCINCKEYDCIKKWLGVKELPKPIQIPSDLPAYAHYTKGYDDGWNACIGEILGEEMTDKEFRYIVIEGYTDGIWYVIDTFENGKVIREFKDQRPLAYDYCEKLNRKAKK